MELNKEGLKLKRKKKENERELENDLNQVLGDDHHIDEERINSDPFVSNEEILSEYSQFLRNLPILPDLEQQKLINMVKDEWDIDKIIKSTVDPEILLHLKNGNNLTDRLSAKLGQSIRVIAPPVKTCLLCKENLSISNYPTQIVVFTLTGPRMYSKYILKCQRCRLIEKSKFNPLDENRRQDVFYHPDKYGNMVNGYMFYKQDIPHIKASNEVYLEKSLVESAMSNFMHGFMSMESAAEAYNETFRHCDSVKQFKDFLDKNPFVCNHFNAKRKKHVQMTM
jgi:hypothetical protein